VIIGSILLNPKCLDQVRKELTLEDFDLEKHRITYKTLMDIADQGKPLELSILINELGNNGGLAKAGGKDYLVKLFDGIATSASVPYHIKELKDIAAKRNLNLLLLKGQDAIKEGTPLLETITNVEEEIEELKEKYKPEERQYIEADDLLVTMFDKAGSVISKGILPAGGGLILAGESGVGKSILRTEIAIHLAMGWDLYGLPINEPRKVMIVQFENPQPTEQYRLKQMLKAFQIESLNGNLIYSKPIRFDLKLKGSRAEAHTLVKDSGADVIIWDPLSSLHQGNENDNIHMRTVLDTITEINRKANTSAIILHHWGKPQEGREEEYRLRGAISIKDWADTLIQMTRKKHKSKILHYLTFTKIRNGPEQRPILIHADKKYFTHDVIEEDTLANPQKVAEILENLGGQVETQAELKEAIIQEVGCSEKTAKNYIKNAVNKTIKEHDTGTKTKGYYVIEE
jgi:RecA-family ATPase